MAGQAMRDTLARARARRPRLGSIEWDAVAAVLASTVSYSRLCDETTLTALAALGLGDESSGWALRRFRDALDRVAEWRIVGVTRYGQGRGSRLVVEVWPDQETHAVTAGIPSDGNARDDSAESHAVTAGIPSDRKPRGECAESHAVSARKATRSPRDTEKYRGEPRRERLSLDERIAHQLTAAPAEVAPAIAALRAEGIDDATLERTLAACVAADDRWPSALKRRARELNQHLPTPSSPASPCERCDGTGIADYDPVENKAVPCDHRAVDRVELLTRELDAQEVSAR